MTDPDRAAHGAHRTTPARCPITTPDNRVAHCPRTPVRGHTDAVRCVVAAVGSSSFCAGVMGGGDGQHSVDGAVK
jgi:hypothetical protein